MNGYKPNTWQVWASVYSQYALYTISESCALCLVDHVPCVVSKKLCIVCLLDLYTAIIIVEQLNNYSSADEHLD